jgi:hypothetical protein
VLMVTPIDRLPRIIGDLQDIVRAVRARGGRETEQCSPASPSIVMDQNPSVTDPPVPPDCGKCQKPLAFITTIPRVTEPGRVRIFQCADWAKLDFRPETSKRYSTPPRSLRTSSTRRRASCSPSLAKATTLLATISVCVAPGELSSGMRSPSIGLGEDRGVKARKVASKVRAARALSRAVDLAPIIVELRESGVTTLRAIDEGCFVVGALFLGRPG